MRTLGYESSFASFLPPKFNRALNSPDSKARAYSDMAAFGLENFFSSLSEFDATRRERAIGEIHRFRENPSSIQAAQLAVTLCDALESAQPLTDGQEVQIRKALIALIDYAKLTRSDVLSQALLDVGRFFDR
jgi:hypothetical protein